jgi:hypothetical protein
MPLSSGSSTVSIYRSRAMDDDVLRALVREAIARHVGGARPPAVPTPWKAHPSHARFALVNAAEPESPCLIEPQVRCNQCGYCKSYGH